MFGASFFHSQFLSFEIGNMFAGHFLFCTLGYIRIESISIASSYTLYMYFMSLTTTNRIKTVRLLHRQYKGRYRLSNVFCDTAAAAATNMMFESLRKNACGTNCHRGWAELAFCGKECLCVCPENRQFLVRSAAIQLCLRTYS